MVDEEKDVNIPIVHPFTLDKRWNEFNEDRPPGFFSELKNYIPQNNVLKTRKGIESLVFTPQVTVVPPWNPIDTPVYSADGETAICACILNFNDNLDLGHNEISSATVNPIFSAMVTPNYSGQATNSLVQFKEGTHALLITNITATISAAAGNPPRFLGLSSPTVGLPDWFPGKSTTGTTFLATAWIYPLDNNANEEDIFRWGDVTNPGIIFRYFDDDLQLYLYNESGGSISKQITASIAEDEWQFVAAWGDYKKNTWGLYHYNDSTQVEQWTATDSISGNYFRLNSERGCIGGGTQWDAGAGGRVIDASEAPKAYIDYMTMWTTLFTNSSSNVTLIRELRDLHKT